MQKWEYATLYQIGGLGTEPHERGGVFCHYVSLGETRIEKNRVDIFLAELGDEGWELVSAVAGGERFYHLYFKRPKE